MAKDDFIDSRNGERVRLVHEDSVNGVVTIYYYKSSTEGTIELTEFKEYFVSANPLPEKDKHSDSSNTTNNHRVHQQFYFDEDSKEFVITDNSGNELYRLDLTRRGDKGDKGERGPKGEIGDQGPRGERGDKGDRGERGAKGDRGDVGPQGLRGDIGEKGSQGPAGDKGEQGEKGEQGVPGIKGDTGLPGADGDTWQPRLSTDGEKIYFVNSKGEQSPEFQILGKRGLKGDAGAPGAKGERGEQGDTWEPRFSDDNTEVYFRNTRTGEVTSSVTIKGDTGNQGIQGPRGESAYQIWKNEGHDGDFHDFLLWIAEQAQKGEDGKDGDTFRPHVEKGGHLFFISTKTGKRIDGGWVKGDKGDQGETGLNGHNVTHKYGYKEIYDWTCPVQEINPHLLASSDDLASGGSAEKHMRETLNRINNLRKEGKKLTSEGPFEQKWANKILYFLKNPLKEFFWWCSGADRPLLRMCPAEHSKYMGIGTVIFFTALMAMVSSLSAISYVFGNHELSSDHEKFTVCVIFAIFWGLMIFFLDRFITNTMYSDGKVTISWLELRSALPRILISIFLGIVISAPLELKIFNQEINDYITSETTKSFTDSLYNQNYPVLTNLYSQCNQDSLALSRAIAKYEKTSNLTGEEKATLYTEYYDENTITETPISYKDADEKIRPGTTTSSSTTRKVVPSETEYKKALYRDSINWRNAERRDSISRAALQQKRDTLIAKFNPNKAVDNAGLYERLAALHAIAFHEDRENDEGAYKPWDKDDNSRFWWFAGGIFALLVIVSLPFTKNVTKDSDKKSKTATNNNTIAITTKKENVLQFFKGAAVLWPWFAVTALICGYCNNALFNALPYYIFSSVGMIMMLFILIDVSPVFYKMMLADGQYEQYLHKEKSITQDLVRLNFAKSIAKVNESEIGRLAPLIFSKPFDKIKEILQGSKRKNSLEWIEGENGEDIRIASQTIRESNEEVFTTVLGMKKAIIEASYQAWYRDMRDAIIGMHKPGGPDGGNDSTNGGPNDPGGSNDGNAPVNDGPNDPEDPSVRARRETGHHTSDDAPFDEENYYGRTTGTSPEYDASSDDPHPGTPEDYLNEEDSHLNNPTDNTSENAT